ncbi:unnamed protein product [Prunus brigantina]
MFSIQLHSMEGHHWLVFNILFLADSVAIYANTYLSFPFHFGSWPFVTEEDIKGLPSGSRF